MEELPLSVGRQRRSRNLAAFFGIALVAGGCIEINLPEEGGLFGFGAAFVTKGTAESIENGGSCLVWRATDGQLYILFQNARISNNDFDTVTTPGIQSRLELTTRNDLGDLCRSDAVIAEVTKVLEIDGVDPAEQKLNDLKVAIDDIVRELEEGVATRRSDIQANIQEAVGVVKDGLEEFVNDVESNIDETFENIRDQLPEPGTVGDALNGFVNDLEGRVSDAIDELDLGGGQLRDKIREATDAVVERLRASVDELINDIGDRLPSLPGDRLEELDELAAQVRQIMEVVRGRLGDEHEARRQEFEDRVNELDAELRGRVATIVDELRGQIDAGKGDLEGLVQTIIANLQPDLADLLPWFTGELDGLVNELEADIDETAFLVGEDNNATVLALVDDVVVSP